MQRTFDIKTSALRLPTGSSPTDRDNIEFVKRFYKSATGAEKVTVGFHEGPDGSPLIDNYTITLEYPTFLADGQYVSLAKKGALDGSAAEIIGRIIKALAQGQDATADIQKLLEVTKGNKGEEKNPEEGSATGPKGLGDAGGSGGSGGGMPGGAPSGGGGLPGGGAKSDTGKPRMPFANRQNKQSNLKKAMLMEQVLKIPMGQGMKIAKALKVANFENFVTRVASVKEELGLDNKDALDIVKLVDSSPNWAAYHKKASTMLVDENDKPLSSSDYAHIAKVARGETAPLG